MSVPKQYCPHCGGPVPKKVAHCAHCGGGLRGAYQPEQDMSCPRCKVILSASVEGDVTLHECEQCKGQWLDAPAFHAATAKPKVYADAAQGEIPVAPYQRPPLEKSRGYAPCPRCNDLMVRRVFARSSNIMIDECGHHGVWLDPGEMDHIRSFIANGGLDQQLRKQIDDVGRIATEARDMAASNKFMRRILHFWNLKRIFFEGF